MYLMSGSPHGSVGKTCIFILSLFLSLYIYNLEGVIAIHS